MSQAKCGVSSILPVKKCTVISQVHCHTQLTEIDCSACISSASPLNASYQNYTLYYCLRLRRLANFLGQTYHYHVNRRQRKVQLSILACFSSQSFFSQFVLHTYYPVLI
jgi:hypothetical protein